MTVIYLGLGSNTDREHHLRRGLDALEQLLGPLELSPVFESDAVGILGTRFYNLVVGAQCQLDLVDLNAALKAIEAACGRREQTSPGRITLDIDILLYGELAGRHDGVLLPRPETRRNAFVLWPLALLAPAVVLPGSDTTIATLWSEWRGEQKVWPVAFEWHGQTLTPAWLLRQQLPSADPAPGSGAA
ncbi:2-amino-4-hydroxy-6-hydroxymethyldihydropteridine diphosphokinase [Pseudomonas sp. G11-1]|uniref:2-amino-4-hydroxy-6-hydroxymethyldihydropteridine diphosphokinase n=1 Tax=Halopseudomonas bauzanensis TaxID=653930 RepID=A0A1H9NQC7_9GAMM|nr:2-amino-4-hydroxy-6-hydroxymethyldihydropteridine diphosphokinase [Halopseudomonas bauzanensis]MCO5785679.1 2-amino-4-hydroxy-6-hydroxymethyldihydropteridine diphosphokinase [Pseudomonas sp. G11-1]MCO5788217.1 2-amino-4-hydroxy-6-hydroxymethyldihydropteridine diphosphokinase [Pseudomonas sp. G11-2]SER38190.1 2-amino-4-hydroxy-6-hydroxymethyldihydropteridinediphosphokinase [Halopseudomonas bauzanensis]SFL79194.1 2-amino-4-hydroxy-6-hydroxymethyldihydropteridinediphosphokinase [Halopseudomonas